MYLESISEKFSIYKDESPRWATLIHEGQAGPSEDEISLEEGSEYS